MAPLRPLQRSASKMVAVPRSSRLGANSTGTTMRGTTMDTATSATTNNDDDTASSDLLHVINTMQDTLLSLLTGPEVSPDDWHDFREHLQSLETSHLLLLTRSIQTAATSSSTTTTTTAPHSKREHTRIHSTGGMLPRTLYEACRLRAGWMHFLAQWHRTYGLSSSSSLPSVRRVLSISETTKNHTNRNSLVVDLCLPHNNNTTMDTAYEVAEEWVQLVPSLLLLLLQPTTAGTNTHKRARTFYNYTTTAITNRFSIHANTTLSLHPTLVCLTACLVVYHYQSDDKPQNDRTASSVSLNNDDDDDENTVRGGPTHGCIQVVRWNTIVTHVERQLQSSLPAMSASSASMAAGMALFALHWMETSNRCSDDTDGSGGEEEDETQCRGGVQRVKVEGLTPTMVVDLLETTNALYLLSMATRLSRDALVAHCLEILFQWAQQTDATVDAGSATTTLYDTTARACKRLVGFGFLHSVDYRLGQLEQERERHGRNRMAQSTTTTTTTALVAGTNETSSRKRSRVQDSVVDDVATTTYPGDEIALSRRDRISKAAYPFLMRLHVLLMKDEFSQACDLCRKVECCMALDNDNDNESVQVRMWSYVFSYLLNQGGVFLDGNDVHSGAYQAKRTKLLSVLNRQLGRGLGVDVMVDWYKNVMEQAQVHEMSTRERNYVTMACQHTVLRLLVDKSADATRGIERFWNEFPSVANYGSNATSWAIRFLQQKNPIPASLLRSDGALVDLGEMWSRSSAKGVLPTEAEPVSVGRRQEEATEQQQGKEAVDTPEVEEDVVEIGSSNEEDADEGAQTFLNQELGIPGGRDGDETADEHSVAALFEPGNVQQKSQLSLEAVCEDGEDEDASSVAQDESSEEENLAEESDGSSGVEIIASHSSTQEEAKEEDTGQVEDDGDTRMDREAQEHPVQEYAERLDTGYEPEGHTEEEASEAVQTEEEEEAEIRRRYHMSRFGDFRAAHPIERRVVGGPSFSDMDAADEMHSEEELAAAESSDTGLRSEVALSRVAYSAPRLPSTLGGSSHEGSPVLSPYRSGRAPRRVVLDEVPKMAPYSPADDNSTATVAASTELRYLSEAAADEATGEKGFSGRVVNPVPPVPKFEAGDDTSDAVAPSEAGRYLSEAETDSGAQIDASGNFLFKKEIVDEVPNVGYHHQDGELTDATRAPSEAGDYLSEFNLDQESQEKVKKRPDAESTRAGYDAEVEDNSEVMKEPLPPRPVIGQEVPKGYLADAEDKSTAPTSESFDMKPPAIPDSMTKAAHTAMHETVVVDEGRDKDDLSHSTDNEASVNASVIVHDGDVSDRMVMTDDETVPTDNIAVPCPEDHVVQVPDEGVVLPMEVKPLAELDAFETDQDLNITSLSDIDPGTDIGIEEREGQAQLGREENDAMQQEEELMEQKSPADHSRSSSRSLQDVEHCSPALAAPTGLGSHTRSHGPANDVELSPRTRASSPRRSTRSRNSSAGGAAVELQQDDARTSLGSPEAHTRSHGPADDVELSTRTRASSLRRSTRSRNSSAGDATAKLQQDDANASLGSPEAQTRSHGPTEDIELPPRTRASPHRSTRSRNSSAGGAAVELQQDDARTSLGSPEAHTRSHGPADDVELSPRTRASSPRRSTRSRNSSAGDAAVELQQDDARTSLGSPEAHTRSHGPKDDVEYSSSIRGSGLRRSTRHRKRPASDESVQFQPDGATTTLELPDAQSLSSTEEVKLSSPARRSTNNHGEFSDPVNEASVDKLDESKAVTTTSQRKSRRSLRATATSTEDDGTTRNQPAQVPTHFDTQDQPSISSIETGRTVSLTRTRAAASKKGKLLTIPEQSRHESIESMSTLNSASPRRAARRPESRGETEIAEEIASPTESRQSTRSRRHKKESIQHDGASSSKSAGRTTRSRTTKKSDKLGVETASQRDNEVLATSRSTRGSGKSNEVALSQKEASSSTKRATRAHKKEEAPAEKKTGTLIRRSTRMHKKGKEHYEQHSEEDSAPVAARTSGSRSSRKNATPASPAVRYAKAGSKDKGSMSPLEVDGKELTVASGRSSARVRTTRSRPTQGQDDVEESVSSRKSSRKPAPLPDEGQAPSPKKRKTASRAKQEDEKPTGPQRRSTRGRKREDDSSSIATRRSKRATAGKRTK